MKRYLLPSAVVVLTSAAILFSFSSPGLNAQDSTPPVASKGQQWEYRVLRIADQPTAGGRDRALRARKSGAEDTLNQLGVEGWELVAVRATGTNTDPVFYFKRPKK